MVSLYFKLKPISSSPSKTHVLRNESISNLTISVSFIFWRKNLCLAGGVALNCVANGKVLRDGRFKEIWIQPAAGDAGGALGGALRRAYETRPKF